MATSSPLDLVAAPMGQVDRAMREQLAGEGQLPGLVGEHVLASGGKRMRPALCLLAAELCGYTGPRRVQVAAAIELLHTATLLHDDVVDLATVRRGQAAANAVWGNRRAVLVGDFLYARASAMIVEDGDLDILWSFSNTIRLMAEGELLQLERSFDPSVTKAHYYAVIERKSAVLLSAACNAGAILGAVTRAERRRLSDFGREVGLAFQLRDDALDYCADERALGKTPCADLREGKVTLPLLLALKRCTGAEREEAAAVLKQAASRTAELTAEGVHDPSQVLSDDEAAPVARLVERYRGVEDTDRRAEDHVARAQEAIEPFPEGPAKRALVAAADFSVARDH
ncbi:MAG: polyprenyl synthetase family protein [Myxococcales bacterium]|nr:polyprenyl synthetase family protein [Myxococcales bacterium]